MNNRWSHTLLEALVCTAALGAATTSAIAQTSPGNSGRTVQHSPAGIDYISGGVGEEDRAAMTGRQSEFPFKIVLSTGSGEYVVADKLSIIAPQRELLTVRDAGPFVLIKLPPGQYKLEASWKGKTEQQTVHVTGAAQTVNWHLAG